MASHEAQVVYDNVAGSSELSGQLFRDYKFFIAQRVPMRAHYCGLVKSNGGRIVMLEKHADFVIVDHCRKDIPSGSISFKFIDQSIKNGALANPEDYLAGPPAGSVREAGSALPGRSRVRNPYTAEDDRIVWQWVSAVKAQGGYISGNEIYKQLELKHPHHTWHSWRDRYLKHLRDKPPLGVSVNAPPSPPTDELPEEPVARNTSRKEIKPRTQDPKRSPVKKEGLVIPPESTRGTKMKKKAEFSDYDFMHCYVHAAYIRNTPGPDYNKAWRGWAEQDLHGRTADDWRNFFEEKVMVAYEQDTKEGTLESNRSRFVEELARQNEEPEEEETQRQSTESSASIVEVNASGAPDKEVPSRKETVGKAPSNNVSPVSNPKKRAQEEAPNPTEFVSINKRQRVSGSSEEEASLFIPHTVSKPREQKKSEGDAAAKEAPLILDVSDYEDSEEEKLEGEILDGTKALDLSQTEGNFTDEYRKLASNRKHRIGENRREPTQAEEPIVLSSGTSRTSEAYETAVMDHDIPRATTESEAGFEMAQSKPATSMSTTSGLSSPAEQKEPPVPTRTRRSAYDTQAILGAETQYADLAIPEPLSDTENDSDRSDSDGDDDNMSDSSEPKPLNEQGIRKFTRDMIRRGYTSLTIKQALLCTTLDGILAECVIHDIHNGKGVPTNMKGVWTEQDDIDYRGGDARKMVRVTEKHGWDECERRLEFLRVWNA